MYDATEREERYFKCNSINVRLKPCSLITAMDIVCIAETFCERKKLAPFRSNIEQISSNTLPRRIVLAPSLSLL